MFIFISLNSFPYLDSFFLLECFPQQRIEKELKKEQKQDTKTNQLINEILNTGEKRHLLLTGDKCVIYITIDISFTPLIRDMQSINITDGVNGLPINSLCL